MRPRPTSVLAITLLVFAWALCVPMLHGHLPGSAAHVHGGPASSDMATGPAHATLDVEHTVGDGHERLASGGAPLPVASGTAAFVLAVSLVGLVAISPRPRGNGAPGTGQDPPIRGSPVGRFEVIRV